MNLLLLLTALLTSLTGMMSGDRTWTARVPAAAVATERAAELAQAVTASAVIAMTFRPAATLPAIRATNLPLPGAFALVPALRLAAEKRRE